MTPRSLAAALLLGVLLAGRLTSSGKVLSGEDMVAMGMPELAGLADGDRSPASLAALEQHGVSGMGDLLGKDKKTPAAAADGDGKPPQGMGAAPTGDMELVPQGDGTSALSMNALTEEEKVGSAIPESMRCDSCHAIAYQLYHGLRLSEGKVSGTALKEVAVVEVLEAVCGGTLRPKTLGTGAERYRHVKQDWGEYCIKDVGGVNRLVGPGCPLEDQSGYAQFGMLKTRLEHRCNELLGEHGEWELYQLYVAAAGPYVKELAPAAEAAVVGGLRQELCGETPACLAMAGGGGGKKRPTKKQRAAAAAKAAGKTGGKAGGKIKLVKEKKTAKLKAAKGPPAATDSPSLPPPPPQADAAAVAGGERQQTLRLIRAVQAKLVAVRSELAGLNTKAAGLEAKVLGYLDLLESAGSGECGVA